MKNIHHTHKTILLCRGLPSSGKSTRTREIRQETLDSHRSCEIYSTDDFHLTESGEYKFDPARLSEAHEWNRQRVLHDRKSDVIIVDNTNITLKEILPYLSIAADHKRDVIFVEPNTPWAWDVDECFRRNTHGVPRETIQRMKDRFQRIGVIT